MRAAVLLLPLLAASCGAVGVVDRARGGRPVLVRSGQPTALTLRRLHALYGIRTVVNLRGAHPGVAWFEDERRGVEEIGARWVHIPMSGAERPRPEQIAAFFDVVEDPANWPVLVHCAGGVHRTGALSALYRIQYQGWSAEDAVAEMNRRGFHWGTRDRSALREFVRSYRRDPARSLP